MTAIRATRGLELPRHLRAARPHAAVPAARARPRARPTWSWSAAGCCSAPCSAPLWIGLPLLAAVARLAWRLAEGERRQANRLLDAAPAAGRRARRAATGGACCEATGHRPFWRALAMLLLKLPVALARAWSSPPRRSRSPSRCSCSASSGFGRRRRPLRRPVGARPARSALALCVLALPAAVVSIAVLEGVGRGCCARSRSALLRSRGAEGGAGARDAGRAARRPLAEHRLLAARPRDLRRRARPPGRRCPTPAPAAPGPRSSARATRVAAIVHDAELDATPELVHAAASAAALAIDNERLKADLRARVEELRRLAPADRRGRRRRAPPDRARPARRRAAAARLARARPADAARRGSATAGSRRRSTSSATSSPSRSPSCASSRAASIRRSCPSAGSAPAVDVLVGARADRRRVRPSTLDERLPAPVEAAAYFVVAEGLTNVVRTPTRRKRHGAACARAAARSRWSSATTASAARGSTRGTGPARPQRPARGARGRARASTARSARARACRRTSRCSAGSLVRTRRVRLARCSLLAAARRLRRDHRTCASATSWCAATQAVRERADARGHARARRRPADRVGADRRHHATARPRTRSGRSSSKGSTTPRARPASPSPTARPTRYDIERMRRLIDEAIEDRPDGLVVSLPDAQGAARRRSSAPRRAGIPVITINSGSDQFRDLGVLAHVGQPEYRAGRRGRRADGARPASAARCASTRRSGNAGPRRALPRLRRRRCARVGRHARACCGVDLQDPRPGPAADRAGGRATARSTASSRSAPAARCRRSPRCASGFGAPRHSSPPSTSRPRCSQAVRVGEMLFAVDQQPYLQGYLPVVLLAERSRHMLFPAARRADPDRARLRDLRERRRGARAQPPRASAELRGARERAHRAQPRGGRLGGASGSGIRTSASTIRRAAV